MTNSTSSYEPVFSITCQLTKQEVLQRIRQKTAKPGMSLVQIINEYWYEGRVTTDKIILQDVAQSRRTRPTLVGQFATSSPVQLIFYSDLLEKARQSQRNFKQGSLGFGGLLLILGVMIPFVANGDTGGLALLLGFSGALCIGASLWWRQKRSNELDLTNVKRFASQLSELLEGEFRVLLPGK